MLCKKCGKEQDDNSKFCNNCGNSFETLPSKSVLQEGTTANKAVSGLIKLGIFIACGFLLGFLIYASGG
jgi:uncharacterized membrane protein YvbJ